MSGSATRHEAKEGAVLPSAPCLLSVRNLAKRFGAVDVLSGIGFSVAAGEVLMLVGENGAGKSTLKNILSGLLKPDAGEIVFNGVSYPSFSRVEVEALGIGTIHQELSLFSNLSVAENIHLPHLPRRGPLVDWEGMRGRARELLHDRLGAGVDPDAEVGSLSLGERQLVEIAKAMHHSSSLLILDEPTTCLSIPERERLLQVVRRLRRDGYSIIYITHFLDEVYAVADRIAVLRDGRLVAEDSVERLPREALARAMVGREISDAGLEPDPLPPEAPVVLRVRNLSDKAVLRDVSLEVRRGEILGVAGLMGAGRSELAESLVGIRQASGEVVLNGERFDRRSPRAAKDRGLVLVSEDRRKDQAFLGRPLRENVTAPLLPRLRSGMLRLLSPVEERRTADAIIRDYKVNPPRPETAMVNLSGGNQQKAIIGRWLYENPSVCILDEPTKGVDIGARALIHRLILDLSAKGVGFVLISSDLPELLGLAHRVVVLHKGAFAGSLPREAFDPSVVLSMASMGRAA